MTARPDAIRHAINGALDRLAYCLQGNATRTGDIEQIRMLVAALEASPGFATNAGGRCLLCNGVGRWQRGDGLERECKACKPAAPKVSAPVEGEFDPEWKLPCDVKLPPATTITAGCKLSTLLHALELRAEPIPDVDASALGKALASFAPQADPAAPATINPASTDSRLIGEPAPPVAHARIVDALQSDNARLRDAVIEYKQRAETMAGLLTRVTAPLEMWRKESARLPMLSQKGAGLDRGIRELSDALLRDGLAGQEGVG